MEFKFNNYARFIKSAQWIKLYNWFDWKVFMDEPPEKLDLVDRVEYRLHKTFPDPIRIVEDRESRFALESRGWGVFEIYITIYLKTGEEEHTKYYLGLEDKPWPSEEP